MTIYVLDASAALRYIDDEAGADRVDAVFSDCDAGIASICISAVQWGEIAMKLRKRLGAGNEATILESFLPVGATIIAVDAERAAHAGSLRVDRGISYADAFALDLAMKSPEHVLVTADYG